ncbi:MAG: hypothetical protein EPN20_12400 [Magnetospirillum sp.]|nr:MAG: hypothetical protein EPN20_12400 [Magnetospirillum sp.]
MTREARQANGGIPPLFYVVDARGEAIRICWTDPDGGHRERELTVYQAACLTEDLSKAVRKRVPGGW